MSEANSEENKSQSEPERNINVGQNYNENIGGDYFQGNNLHVEKHYYPKPEPTKSLNTPSNLNRSGAANFVGREQQLEELHQLLQQNEQVTISAIAGMGGIGKTELALQYALAYKDEYPGSLCWFSVRGENQNLAAQIIEFAGTYLNVFPPKKLESDLAKVGHCWQNWRSEPSLTILDDVPNFGKFYQDQIAPYLPPAISKIKVLMTSRECAGHNISRIDLDVLSEAKALELLQSFIGKSRIEAEPELAKELCQWLGYLPLGLELVGRYIALDETLTIEKTLKRLERKELKAKALLDPEQADMNAKLGVAAAFDLSWDVLSPEAKKLGCYLSLFKSEPFKWSWVEAAWIESEVEDEIEDLEDLRNKQLTQRNLLIAVPDSEAYQLHSLIYQYFRAKLEERAQAPELKQKFCVVMSQIAQGISETPTLEEIRAFTITIPHLTFVAAELTQYVNDENLVWSYLGLGKFYQGQGLYNQGSAWLEQCLDVCRGRLGLQHLSMATSLNNLAELYRYQGRYDQAEPLIIQALALRKQLLGLQHPSVATSLNNLAELYSDRGRYKEAEPLMLQALALRKQLLGEQHPSVAQSLNNLAELYLVQGRYDEAEPLMLQTLALRKQLLGEQHLSVATSLNNLALLYQSQGRYESVEPLYLQALELRKRLLGEQHLSVAASLNNLAYLYYAQGRYEDAEPLMLQALELRKQHPDMAQSLNNLARLYQSQGRYDEAEPLYQQALAIAESDFGENHPGSKKIRNNLNYLRQQKQNPLRQTFSTFLDLLRQFFDFGKNS